MAGRSCMALRSEHCLFSLLLYYSHPRIRYLPSEQSKERSRSLIVTALHSEESRPCPLLGFYHFSGAVSGRSRRFPESPRFSPPFISNPYLRTACVPARNLQGCLPILEFTMLEIGMDLTQETKSSVWKCHALCRVNCAQKVIVRRDS